jgi:NAD(P)-dependent dehydrogenase (short-subunit alcohol dehydrogenase family)
MPNENLNIAIIGASGAIGAEFVNQYAKNSNNIIHAFSRSEVSFAHNNVKTHFIDIENETSIKDAAEISTIDTELDIVIVATGMLHNNDIMPEKSLKDLSADKFQKLFSINTIAPAIIAKHYLPKLKKDKKSLFAALSARVSSVSDNRLGGWYAYRSAKAALNMVLKNSAIEIARTNKNAVIVGLHPGTVDSNLSKPFQSFVKPEKLFTAEYAVTELISVLNGLETSDSGNLYDFHGLKIDF